LWQSSTSCWRVGKSQKNSSTSQAVIRGGLELDQWRSWAAKLGEISRGQDGEITDLTAAAVEARKIMVSINPEEFFLKMGNGDE
jgi:hypothetical protein